MHVAPSAEGATSSTWPTRRRRHPHLALGMSPRATLALQRAARARAAAAGRNYVVPDDLKALAGPVLAHRLSRNLAICAGVHMSSAAVAVTALCSGESRSAAGS